MATSHILPVPHEDVAAHFDWAARKKIGEGAFADVFSVQCHTDGVEYAVKQIFKERLHTDKHWEWLQHEIFFSRQIHHPGCIKCHHIFQDEDFVYLQLELLTGGDLCTMLQRAGPLTEAIVARFMRQILTTLLFLHQEQGIAHLDLKPDNFLCTTKDPDTAEVRIGDFGFAKIFNYKEGHTPVVDTVKPAGAEVPVTPKGTYGYMCPELLRHVLDHKMDPRLTTRPEIQKMDVYSLGVVVYLLLSGGFPHAIRQPKRQHLRSMRFGPAFNLPIWQTVSSLGKQFCRSLLEPDATRRPLVSEVLEHPWLREAAADPLPAPMTPVSECPGRELMEELRAEALNQATLGVTADESPRKCSNDVLLDPLIEVVRVVPRSERPMVTLLPVRRRPSLRVVDCCP